MADRERDLISDPKRLRALAHPLRWRLLSLIDSEGTATATRCAEVLGESVASCSYHLNMLAKYDYLEKAPGHGREKPWKLTRRDQSFGAEGLSLEGELAREAAAEAFLEFEFAGVRDRVRAHSRQPEAWRLASRLTASSLYLTADELREINERLDKLLAPYDDRWDNPGLRPDGARQVRFFASLFPNSEPS
jgi:hypothetical protein